MIDWDNAYTSGEYLHWWDNHAPSQELVTCLASGLIPKGSTFLDLGCGSGQDAVAAAQYGLRVTGVDISFYAVAIASKLSKSKNVTSNWSAASAFNLPFADNTFHFVSDRGCLHHIFERDRQQFFDEIARVLNKHGHLMVRGASAQVGDIFEPITSEKIDPYLQGSNLKRGDIVPFTMGANNDRKELEGNITFVSKI
jgi:ubiquinone/menaquinone biosynthesis C-methylase UbiE